MSLSLSMGDQSNQDKTPVAALQKQESVELFLAEGLTYRAVAQRLGCATAPWPSGFAKPASIAEMAAPAIRAS